MQVIDYDEYVSDLVTETMRYFAKIIKEETHGKKICGAFYGYVLEFPSDTHQQNAGHLNLQKTWSTRDIDYFTSPTSYHFRTLDSARGYSQFMSLTDAIKLRGKLWIDENDIRTWKSKAPIGYAGRTATYDESLLLQKRELANVVAQGCGQWWFDQQGGWYDDSLMMLQIAKIRAVADSAVSLDKSAIDEIAFIVDDKSLLYMKPGNIITKYLLVDQLPELGRIGAPFGLYTIEDLPILNDRKMFIFANCFAPTEKQRRIIDRTVKKTGKVVLWMYAPGFIKSQRIDFQSMEQLTGFRHQYMREEGKLKVITNPGASLVVPGLPSKVTYGGSQSFGPIFYVEDSSAVALGSIQGRGLIGLATKTMPGGWISIYSAAPILPASVLRAFAKLASVHSYIESSDVIFASKQILSLVATSRGKKEISLPNLSDVVDLFTGKTVGANIRKFEIEASTNEVFVWKVVPHVP